MATRNKPKRSRVAVSEIDSQVILHPADNDIFVRTGRQVIQACQLGISIDLWLSELEAMQDFTREWASGNSAHIRSCFCAPRGSQIALFFLPKSDRFDFVLANKLAELNGKLVKDFNVGMVEIHQIPKGELERFINLDSARLIYGEEQRSHSPVEA